MAKQAKAVLQVETLEAVADQELLPQPGDPRMPRSRHQIGGPLRQAGLCLICQRRTPSDVQLGSDCHIAIREEDGKMLRRYWTTVCQNSSLTSRGNP